MTRLRISILLAGVMGVIAIPALAQLQVRLEELRAQNLRLEQENLRAQRQLSQRSGGPTPGVSSPTPPSP